jgi:hypothetical protein
MRVIFNFSKVFFVSVVFAATMAAYDQDDNLKVSIVEKAAQFMTLKGRGGNIVITVYNNSYGDLFEKVFAGKQIDSKNIKIKYANAPDKIEDTTILYIANANAEQLTAILKKVDQKNTLTVSDIRGFAEKGGVMQVYIASQKAKLKINLDAANKEDIKIKASLLRIAEVIKESK